MGFRLISPRHLKKAKTYEAQEVLERLKSFLDGNFEEPVRILHGFWKDQQDAISYQELREAVKVGMLDKAVYEAWSRDYSILVARKLKPLWEDAIRAGSLNQSEMSGVSYNFNIKASRVMEWVQKRGAAFVTAVSDEQKQAIQALLAKKIVENHTVDELARFIRPCIGLTKGQAKANLRYYENMVFTLKKDHPRMKPESIEKKAREAAAKYAERQHRQRAMTIAQTESAFAYNWGAHEEILQAQEQGLMGKVIKRWSTSGDDQVCSICQGLEGMELGMDEGFKFRGRKLFAGQDLLPPAHPRCACAVEYVEMEQSKYTEGLQYSDSMNAEEANTAQDRFGIFTNNNPSDERYYDYEGKDLQQVEKEIAERKFETAVCFGKDGKAKFAQIGDEDSIKFTKIQLLQMKGADITHNHPLSTPPSPEDVYLLKNYKANSFRTTGKNGTYVLAYSKEVENLPDFNDFDALYDALLKEKSIKYREKVRDGADERKAIRDLGEEIWEEIYQQYGVKPVFERW